MTLPEPPIGRAVDPDIDTSERLCPDDMATRREGEFLSAALRAQASRASKTTLQHGLCANCGAQCLPHAVYCDDECRADDERRRRVLARQGRAA